MHHAAKVNVVPRLFSISYEDAVSGLKFKLLSGTNIYKKISPLLGCLRVSDIKGRYINSDISKQSFAIEGSLTKSTLVSLSKATRRVLSDLYSEKLFCIRSLLKKLAHLNHIQLSDAIFFNAHRQRNSVFLDQHFRPR